MHNPRVNIYLALEDGPHAPEGPGWYITATNMDDPEQQHVEEIVPHVRLAGPIMEKLAQVIDNFTKDQPQNWNPNQGFVRTDMSLREAVRKANEEAQQTVQARIDYLTRAQNQLDMLRARAREFDTED